MDKPTSLETQIAALHESNHYPPIENHGVIGNMKTLALVSTEGTIDFHCFPHFDSPAVFCSLLDSVKGGFWSIKPNGDEKVENRKQFYLPDSNVLVTRFFTEKGVAQVIDYMPVHDDYDKRKQMNCIVREVSGKSGEVTLYMKCKPTFNWGRCSEKQEVRLFRVCKKQTIRHEVSAFSATKASTSELCSQDCDVCDRRANRESATKKEHVQSNEERQNVAVFYSSSGLALSLLGNVDMEKKKDCREYIYSEFTVKEGDIVTFILKESEQDLAEMTPFEEVQASYHSKYKQKQKEEEEKMKEGSETKCGNGRVRITLGTKSDLFHNTLCFWRHWLTKCTYKGRWREMVHRSALVLKLLTFEETGAIIAAGTTSLPESLGGTRNWDYRYTWIRDASFTLYGLLRIGFTEEAEAFMRYLQKIAINEGGTPSKVGPLQIMYKIDGSKEIPEEDLEHLEGYKKSGPVRQGNAAYEQFQLDIYGELMDSIYLYNKYAAPLSYDTWVNLVDTLNWLAENWNKPDEGIWEMRSGKKNYVYSRIMCWVAFDRGLRLADKRSFPCPRTKWLEIRDTIYQEIMEKGWNEERQAFKQAYENDSLDAANLIMPLVFFMAPNDPKFLKTLLATAPNSCIKSGGLISNGLVMRYDNSTTEDSLPGVEGSFNICSFWLIEAMTRAGRHDPHMLDDARWKFEDMLSYANHVGLFAEQTSTTGSQLGNFPQAFSHLSLISAAFNLDRVLNETRH